MKPCQMPVYGLATLLLVPAGGVQAGQRSESEPISWCLACNNEVRELGVPVQVPAWATRLTIGVLHGYDDTGDGKVEVLLLDGQGGVVLTDKAGTPKWADFPARVSQGPYRILLRDEDTGSGGEYPGNGGKLIYVLEGATPTTAQPVRQPSNAESHAADYLGCYRDQGDPTGTGGRDLPGHLFSSETMTIGACIARCAAQGYVYAGLQFGSQCFCGSAYGGSGAVERCNTPCSGETRAVCGGEWANSVYRTGMDQSSPEPASAVRIDWPSYRVDACLRFGEGCGKPAADRYCQDGGFHEATAWEVEEVGLSIRLGDREVCQGDGCRGFSFVRCR